VDGALSTRGHSHVKAARALDIHEEAVGGLNETLQLVLALLVRGIGVEKIILNLCARIQWKTPVRCVICAACCSPSHNLLPAYVCLPAVHGRGREEHVCIYACSCVFPTNTQPHPAASSECSTLTTERVCVFVSHSALVNTATLPLFQCFSRIDDVYCNAHKHCTQPQRARSSPFSFSWPPPNTPGAECPRTRHPHRGAVSSQMPQGR
jgi:hypothetical protein